jgi:hypothetical protein
MILSHVYILFLCQALSKLLRIQDSRCSNDSRQYFVTERLKKVLSTRATLKGEQVRQFSRFIVNIIFVISLDNIFILSIKYSIVQSSVIYLEYNLCSCTEELKSSLFPE